MATILIISRDGDGVSLALRLASERHIVKMWVKEAKGKSSLEGYKNPSKVDNPRKGVSQYDLVLSDMAGLGGLCEELKGKGRLVLGGGTFNDKLELDREYGLKVARSLMKIKVPKSELFNNLKSCLTFLKGVKKAQVIKPLGNKPTGLTLVSSDPLNRTLISYLERIGDQLVPCIVQEVVEGVEVSTEGWFNGKGFVKPFNHTFEKKRFMEGDKGPNTGCMGNIVWPTEGDRLTKEVLEPLVPLLTKVNYLGPLDVNCIVNEKDAHFLEFTPRLGYDAIQAWTELLRQPLFEFFYWIALGQSKEVPYLDEQAIAVRLSVSPWPQAGVETGIANKKGIQFLDVPEEAKHHVWLSDVMLDSEGVEVLGGVDGVLGCITARGSTVRECRRRVYRTVGNVVIQKDVQYREDIGSDVEGKKEKLKKWGWV